MPYDDSAIDLVLSRLRRSPSKNRDFDTKLANFALKTSLSLTQLRR